MLWGYFSSSGTDKIHIVEKKITLNVSEHFEETFACFGSKTETTAWIRFATGQQGKTNSENHEEMVYQIAI